MVPFFGSTATQNMGDDTYKTLLEAFTGTGEVLDVHKVETGPRFELCAENIFGTPNLPEEYRKNRYIQSNLKTNLRPTPQVRVAPMSEFEEKFRPYMKNVDALRVKTNPKISFAGRTQGPAHGTDQRGYSGKVSKNRPEKDFYIADDYVIPAPAGYKANKMDEDYTTAMQCTQREQEPANYGTVRTVNYTASQTRLKRKKIKAKKC